MQTSWNLRKNFTTYDEVAVGGELGQKNYQLTAIFRAKVSLFIKWPSKQQPTWCTRKQFIIWNIFSNALVEMFTWWLFLNFFCFSPFRYDRIGLHEDEGKKQAKIEWKVAEMFHFKLKLKLTFFSLLPFLTSSATLNFFFFLFLSTLRKRINTEEARKLKILSTKRVTREKFMMKMLHASALCLRLSLPVLTSLDVCGGKII